MMNGRTKFPFTATQFQELEQQALIFKYMVSGIPIRPDLIFTIKRSSSMDTSAHGSWKCLHMGLGRNVDPEPGRCRRTDGKKWRCSKEAYKDSKYCERHMHRGKNRSREPVELKLTATTMSNPSITMTHPCHYHPFMYSHASRPSRGVREEVDHDHAFFSEL